MTFIEEELFHDKRMNFTIYENLTADFIRTELGWPLLKGSSSSIKEGI
jgi:hypothetical protein